ncbi:MAG: endonuclease/exonuclease/phosphatase family protein [Clostridiales bacterium]|nr:endonuclease/exonuclease/phosphatase family protein [Clostridiales bacterium]
MITLGTFNLRVDQKIDGRKSFSHRKQSIVEKFSSELPVVMGLQEVNDNMMAYLKTALPQYAFLGSGRNKDRTGEHSPIVYLKEELSLEDFDTFWLSPKPDQPGSRYLWQSPYPRICTWATFYHPKSQTRFRIYNTHFDHLSPYARRKSLFQILSFILAHQKTDPLPFFFLGDLNYNPLKTKYGSLFLSALSLQNVAKELTYTFHGFRKKKGIRTVDYIFTNIKKASFPLDLWEKSPEGDFLSDHRGLVIAWNISRFSAQHTPEE